MVSGFRGKLASRMVGAGVVGLVASLLTPTPAAAVIDPVPTVKCPVKDEVLLTGPKNIWGMRDVARNLDERMPELRIYFGGDHPNATRVVVRIVDTLPSNYGGLTHWCQDPVVIELNPKYGPNKRLAAHEFAHAMGLDHHMLAGVVGQTGGVYLSRVEVRALRVA